MSELAAATEVDTSGDETMEYYSAVSELSDGEQELRVLSATSFYANVWQLTKDEVALKKLKELANKGLGKPAEYDSAGLGQDRPSEDRIEVDQILKTIFSRTAWARPTLGHHDEAVQFARCLERVWYPVQPGKNVAPDTPMSSVFTVSANHIALLTKSMGPMLSKLDMYIEPRLYASILSECLTLFEKAGIEDAEDTEPTDEIFQIIEIAFRKAVELHGAEVGPPQTPVEIHDPESKTLAFIEHQIQQFKLMLLSLDRHKEQNLKEFGEAGITSHPTSSTIQETVEKLARASGHGEAAQLAHELGGLTFLMHDLGTRRHRDWIVSALADCHSIAASLRQELGVSDSEEEDEDKDDIDKGVPFDDDF